MILISVKSGLMDVKRQYETDKEAEKYLKAVNDTHHRERIRLAKKHVYDNFGIASYDTYRNKEKSLLSFAASFIKTCLPLKVEVINTDHAQLNMLSELMKSHDNFHNVKNVTL